MYDRFRERITFPLADARGRVLGFGARAMRDDQGAKYINTAEGELYHKGRQLFGIDRARAAVAKGQRVIVVEGYTDVLALHDAGMPETVGVMGTALTKDQMGELARLVGTEGTIYLALDADRSGQEAMLRAARLAEDRAVSLRVVRLPDGQDPADLVTGQGRDVMTDSVTKALSVLEFAVGRVLADGELDDPEGRDRALNAARELIAAAPARSARRDHLVRMVADRLDVPADYVEAQRRGPDRPAPAAAPGRRAGQDRPRGRVPGAVPGCGRRRPRAAPAADRRAPDLRRPSARRATTCASTSTIRSPPCPATSRRWPWWSPGPPGTPRTCGPRAP